MFEASLTDFAEQLALFETETYAEFSQIQEEAFVDLIELDPGADDESSSAPNTDLDESQFASLDQSGFVELDLNRDWGGDEPDKTIPHSVLWRRDIDH